LRQLPPPARSPHQSTRRYTRQPAKEVVSSCRQHTAFWGNTAAKKRRNGDRLGDRLDHNTQTTLGYIPLIRFYPFDHRYAFLQADIGLNKEDDGGCQ
jgi:hypothetical protein